MKVMVDKKILLQALETLSGLTSKRALVPYEGVYKLQALEKLEITASSLEATARAMIPADVHAEGIIYIDAYIFRDIIKSLKPGVVMLEVFQNDLLVKAERVKFKIPTTTIDYPETDIVETNLQLTKDTLFEMLDRTIYAASTDDSIRNMNGVYWDSRESELRLVATDGFRLSLTKASADSLPVSFLAPLKGMQTLRTILKESVSQEVSLGFSGKRVRISVGDFDIFFNVVDAEFPEYERVIPNSYVSALTISSRQLEDALKRLSVISKHVVIFNIQAGSCVLKASDNEKGEGSEELELVEFRGEDMEIAVNPKFLLDFLKHVSGDVQIEFSDSTGPVKIYEDETFFNIIMPMRI